MSAGELRRMDEPTQAALERARAGNAEAFGELYRSLYRRVRGLCGYLLGSNQAAEDAASEVFLRARQAMSSYDSTLPFSRWLFSITSHYCVDVLRRRRTEQRLFEPEEADLPGIAA